MWLGMLAGIAGQLPLLPVEPLNWLDSLCLAYIAEVAHWLAAPDWALLTVHLRSVWAVAAAYGFLLLGMELLLRGLALLRARRRWPVAALPVCLAAASAAALLVAWPFRSTARRHRRPTSWCASSTSGRAIPSCYSLRMGIRCSSTPVHPRMASRIGSGSWVSRSLPRS